jgi:hypothetical protein
VEMENRLKAAANDGAPALIVRAGDYFGPKSTGNSVFAALMVRPGAPVRWIIDPARAGSSHAWAYLPDVGETIARLMDREDQLADFEAFNFACYQLASGEMAASIAKAVGKPDLRVWRFPWFAVVALQPLVRLFREMAEMRYLWSETISLDGSKLRALLGRRTAEHPARHRGSRHAGRIGLPPGVIARRRQRRRRRRSPRPRLIRFSAASIAILAFVPPRDRCAAWSRSRDSRRRGSGRWFRGRRRRNAGTS